MSRKSLFIVAAMLAAVPVGAHAQAQGARPERAPMGPMVSPAEFLLSRSAQLDLSDDQVVRLAELARQATVTREELRAELQALRPATRPQTDAEREAMRESMRQVRARYQAELEQQREAALAVLTDAQREEARQLLARTRARNAPSAMAPRGARPQRPGMRGRPMAPRGDRQAPEPAPQAL